MASSSSLPAPIKALADDALGFLKKYAIVFQPAINLPPEYRPLSSNEVFKSGEAFVKLVQTTRASVYELQFVPKKDGGTDKEAVEAFVLGYNTKERNNNVPNVDIPRKNSPHNFVFTVGLTGCSVIVTRLDGKDGKMHRVYHDGRIDSAVLYDDVEMFVNYNDYRIGGRYRTGMAFTCMQFKGGEWKMFVQRQLQLQGTASAEWEVYAAEQKRPCTPELLETAFNNQRSTVVQKRVKSIAQLLKVDRTLIDGAKDGVVRGVEYDEDAIRGWEALRKAIESQIQKDRQKGISSALRDTYYRYEDDVLESKLMDRTWIWLQVKKNKAR